MCLSTCYKGVEKGWDRTPYILNHGINMEVSGEIQAPASHFIWYSLDGWVETRSLQWQRGKCHPFQYQSLTVQYMNTHVTDRAATVLTKVTR